MNKKTAFAVSAHAKCILAGEHTVMRRCPAVVMPVPSKMITLHFESAADGTTVECDAPYRDIFLLFFWNTIQNGLSILNKNMEDIHGKFVIENNIPMGAGIGFSAALCVVIARFFIWKKWLKEKDLFEFARRLENLYHGKSSGIDIAGVMLDAGAVARFEASGHMQKIPVHWRPKLYISYSGYIKNTADAVNQVGMLRKNKPKLAKMVDSEMEDSVHKIEKSLKMNAKEGIKLLSQAIEQANHCFEEWHLITPELRQHIVEVRDMGAIAVKPTGAGIGGYILSLWYEVPPQGKIELIPLFGLKYKHPA